MHRHFPLVETEKKGIMKKKAKKEPKVKPALAKLKNPVKSVKERRAKKDAVTTSAVVPLITTETIAEHREEVLKGARKYIYPLQHSKHKIVVMSSAILITIFVLLFSYGIVALYRLQSTSTFVYRISQVVPFPVAKADGDYISYESYLFELRHYMHYFESQVKLSFDSQEGQEQLAAYKKQALDKVVNDAYVKKLADENNISVSNQEVDAEIAIVRQQNRLGDNDKVFEDVLRDFWGWSLNDFKRSLRQQLLATKVMSTLDKEAHAQAESAMAELKAGTAFADVAKKYSQDETTKPNGGEYPGLVDPANRDISARITNALFKLKAGETSEIIDTGYTLEILRVNAYEGDKAKASHIQFNLKDISQFINPLKEENKAKLYIKV